MAQTATSAPAVQDDPWTAGVAADIKTIRWFLADLERDIFEETVAAYGWDPLS